MLHKWSLHWKWQLDFARMTDKNKTAKGKLTLQRNVKYMRLLRPYEMFLVIIIGNVLFFFCLCMYMGGQLKNRFSFWVAINIILKFLLMEAHQCWRIRPARLHCTPLHVRFFSGGFVSFWVQYVISGFILRDSPVIQKIKKLPYPHTNLAWSPCMHFLKVLSENVW